MRQPVITFLSDYGLLDTFVGVCHGVMAAICPPARIIDLTHGISRGDVRTGALTLAEAVPFAPVGVHLAVVDPGVGGDRQAVALELEDGRFAVGPDNGLLWPLAVDCGGVRAAVEISESAVRLEPVSATFHGRDLFAPVAANLAAGASLGDLGHELDPAELVRLELPLVAVVDGELVAEVTLVDRFGNVATAATADDVERLGLNLGSALAVRVAGHELHRARFVRTFAAAEPGELIALLDSSRRLALAFNGDSAARRLGLKPEDALGIAAAPVRPAE